MNLYSFLKKKHSKPFVGAIFALVFLSSFFVAKAQAQAQTQTASYYEFECLFAPLVNRSCDHTASTADVWSGTRSGIAYGKIPKDTTVTKDGVTTPVKYAVDEGVKAITMVLSIAMDETKIQDPITHQAKDTLKGYFITRVADSRKETFVVRIGIKVPDVTFGGITYPGGTYYVLKTVPYKDNAEEAEYDGHGHFINEYGKDKDGKQFEIPFFTKGGDRIVTKQVLQATILAPDDFPVIPYGTKNLTADFWYCGGRQDDVGTIEQRDGRYAQPGDRVQYFTKDGKYKYLNPVSGNFDTVNNGIKYNQSLCETEGMGTAHYKIGQTITFDIPSKADVEAEQATEIDTGIKATANATDDTLPACAVTAFGDGSLMGCVARVIYYVFYWPMAWVAGILGKCFDFFLGYSISDESYRASIIVTGWKLVRDISNIFFIIILIWTGFATVFDIGGISMKKVVPALIINALIINFSLFGTQVIIDISNITARLFYNTMTVCEGDCQWKDTPKGKILLNPNKETVGGYKSLSSKIVASFNPQTIFKTTTLDSNTSLDGKDDGKTTQINGFNSQSSDANLQAGSSAARYTSDYAGYFIVVTLIAAALMFVIAKMFFGVMFMFLGRVVGLYIVMIFSPFAVLTRGNMPLVGKIKDLAWDSWWEDLTNYALLAPIFVFFLYIIYAFINSDMSKVFVSSITNSVGFMETIMAIVIPMLIIYTLLSYGVTLAKKYAGKAGEALQGLGKSATGVAATVALGGVGVAAGGLAMAGRGAVRGLDKTGLSKWAASKGTDVRDADGNIIRKGNGVAAGFNKMFKWGQKSSMDIRNTKGLKSATSFATGALGMFGVKTNTKMAEQASSAIGIGADSAKGGNVQARKDREKEREKRTTEKTDMSHLTDKQVEEVWRRRGVIDAEKAWEKARMAELEDGAHEGEKGLSKAKSDELKAKRTDAEAITKAIEEAFKNGDKNEEAIQREKGKKNMEEQNTITAPLAAILKENKKGGDYKKTDLYDEARKKSEKEREDRYGKVTSAKDLSAVMRYEYAERMLADSRFLVDGGKNTATMILGGALTGGLLTNYIDSQQEAARVVFSKIAKDFKKAHSAKDNKIVKYTEELNSITDLIDTHVREAILASGDNIDFDSIKDKEEEKKKYFEQARKKSKREAEMAKIDLDDAKDKYKKAKSSTPPTDPATLADLIRELHAATDKHSETKDKSETLDNAHKERERINKDLEREKKAAADADDKKKAASEKAKPTT